MVKKTFAMKDVMYRKSSPGRELWHTEVSFDYDFYLLVLALVAALAVVGVVVCRVMHGMKHTAKALVKRKPQ